ncbi:MAG: hypothetical protein UHY90_08945 [Treponema sp.]|nr:hypothetical protein [Treponema sp.]
MKALIPHKDTLFFLADMQKHLISFLQGKVFLYPLFPLFAFSEKEIPLGMTSCTIEVPVRQKEFLFFPVKVEYESSVLNLQIKFARTADNDPVPDFSLSEEIKNAFPKRERIFRIADIVYENNTWQVFNDKWCKVK